MPAYYVWSFQKSSNIVEFIITNGSITGGIDQGNSFFETVLHELGLSGNILNSSTLPIRTMYFSEYIGEDDWRDVWQLVWKCRVTLENQESSQISSNDLYVETNATGSEWIEEPDKNTPVNCYVLADFSTSESLQNAIEKVKTTDFTSNQYNVGKPAFHQSTVKATFHQLQIDLGKFPTKFYEDNAQYALEVIDICEDAGGYVNHERHYEDEDI